MIKRKDQVHVQQRTKGLVSLSLDFILTLAKDTPIAFFFSKFKNFTSSLEPLQNESYSYFLT